MAPSSNSQQYACTLRKYAGGTAGSARNSVAALVVCPAGVRLCMGLHPRAGLQPTLQTGGYSKNAAPRVEETRDQRRPRGLFLGLFRDFSKFDNHEKSPFECDSPNCLLSAVAPPTCAESLALVNSLFMIAQSACDGREVKRKGAREPAESRVSARPHQVMFQ
jgi:hypothetical protein